MSLCWLCKTKYSILFVSLWTKRTETDCQQLTVLHAIRMTSPCHWRPIIWHVIRWNSKLSWTETFFVCCFRQQMKRNIKIRCKFFVHSGVIRNGYKCIQFNAMEYNAGYTHMLFEWRIQIELLSFHGNVKQ